MEYFTEQFNSHVAMGNSITCKVGDVEYTAYLVKDIKTSIDDDPDFNIEQAEGLSDELYNNMMEGRRAYEAGEWGYCHVILSIESGPWTNGNISSRSGIEYNYPNMNNRYLTNIANELLEEHLSDKG